MLLRQKILGGSWRIVISALLDTNILLDSMFPARPQHAQAKRLVELASHGRYQAHVSAGSLKDIYYVACKYVDEGRVREFIRLFMQIFHVCAVDMPACKRAVDSDEPDFEDGIIRAIAEVEGADFIITRDTAAYMAANVGKLDAAALLDLVEAKPGHSN